MEEVPFVGDGKCPLICKGFLLMRDDPSLQVKENVLFIVDGWNPFLGGSLYERCPFIGGVLLQRVSSI